MITLTNPPSKPRSLGGNDTAAYDIMEIAMITYNHELGTIIGTTKHTSSAFPAMPAKRGRFTQTTANSLELDTEDFGVNAGVPLSPAQRAAALGIIRDAVNAMEAAFISLGLVQGVRTPEV